MRAWRLGGVVLVSGFLACSASKGGSSSLVDSLLDGGAPNGGASSGGASSGGSAGSDDDAGDGGLMFEASMPTPDGACGYTAVTVSPDPAHLYFVIDRSGSMNEVVDGKQKFPVMRNAVVDLVGQIGWRVQIGATMFPDPANQSGCGPGIEVFPLQAGDPSSYYAMGTYGPVTDSFESAINIAPGGGTPTAATLSSLANELMSFGQNTFVILATDGGPNCDGNILCDAATCTENLDGVDGCTPTLNCCDPTISNLFTPLECLDSNATLSAVTTLGAAGIKVIVVGIPGSAAYSDLLDSLAVAGGAPRADTPHYYRVDDLGDLDSVLSQIGTNVVVSCDFTLSAPPMNPELVNVWFGDTEVYQDPDNGWTWTGTQSIEVHGTACDQLNGNGGPVDVQIFEGCPTMTPPTH